MFKRCAVLLFLAVFVCMNASCCSPKQLDPLEGEITALTGEFIDLLVDGDYTGAVAFFDSTMARAMPARKLGQAWEGLLQQAGSYLGQADKKVVTIEGHDAVLVTTEFEHTRMVIRVVFGPGKRVAGLWFDPA